MNNSTTNAVVSAGAPAASSGGLTGWKDKLIDYVINHSGALVSAIIVIVVGLLAARWIGRTLDRWREEILNHHRTGASNGPAWFGGPA